MDNIIRLYIYRHCHQYDKLFETELDTYFSQNFSDWDVFDEWLNMEINNLVPELLLSQLLYHITILSKWDLVKMAIYIDRSIFDGYLNTWELPRVFSQSEKILVNICHNFVKILFTKQIDYSWDLNKIDKIMQWINAQWISE